MPGLREKISGFEFAGLQGLPAVAAGLGTSIVAGEPVQNIQARQAQQQQQQQMGSLQLLGAQDQARVQSVVQGAMQLKQIRDPQQKLNFLINRKTQLSSAGLDTSDTDEAIGMIQAGDLAGLEQATDQAISLGQQLAGRGQAGLRAFAPQEITTGGQRGLGVPIFDPNTGEVTLEQVPLGESQLTKETPEQRRFRETIAAGEKTLRTEQRKQSVQKSGELFDKLSSITKSVININDAIAAIDRGAKTGAVEKFLPSIRSSSIELDNVAARMGLDIVGATTFGALSESELKFALDTAMPKGLNQPQLRDWLERKKDAQNKLRSELRDSLAFLNRGGTLAELEELKMKKEQAPAPAQQAQPAQIKFLGFE